MKIRLQAVYWEMGEGIKFTQFMQHLETIAPPPLFGDKMGTEFKGRRRLIYTAPLSKTEWGGLLVTVKEAKAFLKLTKDAKGNIALALHEVDESHERIADFNFFVFNSETGRGAYSYYHQSCSFDDFTMFARGEYRELKEKIVEQKLKLLRSPSKTKEREASRTCKGLLYGTVLLRRGEAARLVRALAGIESLELAFTEVQIDKAWGQPLQEVAVLERMSYRFDQKKTPILKLRNAVARAIELSGADRGRVVGSNEDGFDTIVDLRRNIGFFAELNFKQTVMAEKFDVEHLDQSATIKNMRQLISDVTNQALFVAPARGKAQESPDEN